MHIELGGGEKPVSDELSFLRWEWSWCIHPRSTTTKPASGHRLGHLLEKKSESHTIKIFTILPREWLGGHSHQTLHSCHKKIFWKIQPTWLGITTGLGRKSRITVLGKSHVWDPTPGKGTQVNVVRINDTNFIHSFVHSGSMVHLSCVRHCAKPQKFKNESDMVLVSASTGQGVPPGGELRVEGDGRRQK